MPDSEQQTAQDDIQRRLAEWRASLQKSYADTPAQAPQTEPAAAQPEPVSQTSEPAARAEQPGNRMAAANGRVKSGIPGFDELIGGGFEPRSTVLVTGDPGSGKSTFVTQFLNNGAVQYGEGGILITFEERREDIVRRAREFGWDLEQLEADKKLRILEYPPHEVERFIAEGEIIRDMIADIGAKRVVIDSMTSFALVYENEYKMRLGILKVIDSFKKWGCTTLLVSEGSINEQGDVRDRFGIEYLTDGTVYLYNKRMRDYRQKLVEVVEMKGVKHDNSIHPVSFGKDGITVEARSE